MKRSLKNGLFGAIVLAGSTLSTQAFAFGFNNCEVRGNYGYMYHGVMYDSNGAVEIAEIGSFNTQGCADGSELCGRAKSTLRFSAFPNVGPLWVLLDLYIEEGNVEASETDSCAGTAGFKITGTVLQSVPSVLPPGTVLFFKQPRTIAYTVSGVLAGQIDLINTDAGSVITGTAKKQIR